MSPYRDSKLVRIALVVFFLLLLGYALYEGWGFLSGPSINISNTTVTVREPYTLIKGRADRIVELRLNGKTIPVTEEGNFEEPYLLAEGSNRLILEARDARGRTTRQTLDIVYVPQQGPPPPVFPAPTTTDTNTPGAL